MSLKNVGIGDKAPEVVNVIIETSRRSHNKYEMDKDTGVIFLDRVQQTFLNNSDGGDYGMVPGTLGEDGDALDAILLINESVPSGVVVRARVLGYMNMIDSGEQDEKLIVVADDDEFYRDYQDINDVPQHWKNAVQHSFEHYKDLKGKKVEVVGWENKAAALDLIERSLV
ncbi:inorganic diphosphatase [bacterium]|nr:inorganic diphosphatase [bacterium]